MASNNIPVPFDFFKKHTFHEECVAHIIKLKAKGNQQLYERLSNDKEAQERALKAYYEAFYLRPKIRESYHIRVKPVPKKFKDKLLFIPLQATCPSNESVEDIIMELTNDDVSSVTNDSESKKHISLATEDAPEEASLAGGPMHSADVTTAIQEANPTGALSQTQNDKVSAISSVSEYVGNKETQAKSDSEKNNNQENVEIQKDMQQTNEKADDVAPAGSSDTQPSFNYADLLKYIHCCPLKYKEFRQYSNIIQLAAEYCKEKNLDVLQQRKVIHRSYVIFYLAPECRKTTLLLSKIKCSENCPPAIKEKFFNIPTNLYLKEKNIPKSAKETSFGIQNDGQQEINVNRVIVGANVTNYTSRTHENENIVKNVGVKVTEYANNESQPNANSAHPAPKNNNQNCCIEVNNDDIQKTNVCVAIPVSVAKNYIEEQSVAPELADFKIENNAASPDSKSKCLKRTSPKVTESPSPKRQKVLQTKDNSNNIDKQKKSYKDLLPYAHCCPITFSEFTKYTNAKELFTGYCQKRYNGLRKLPYMLHRAYILYYLSAENRNLSPLNKLQIQDECPLILRDKVFEIPTKLFLKDEKHNLVNPEELTTVTQTKLKADDSKTARVSEPIEILENRLLSPVAVPLPGHFNMKDIQCTNNTCVFYHISYAEFKKHTNILTVSPQPHDGTVETNIFKKCIYKIVKEQICDEKYMIGANLLCKLFRYRTICQKCENEVKTLLNVDTPVSPLTENDRSLSTSYETVIERCNEKKESTPSSTKSAPLEERRAQHTTPSKSSIASQGESLPNDQQTQRLVAEIGTQDAWKYLRKDKIFGKFCKKLLTKLKQSFDATVDFSAETYKIFLECNKVPIEELLRNCCENKEDIVQRILNQSELYDTLQRYYYFKYLKKQSVKVLEENFPKNTKNITEEAAENEIRNSNSLDRTKDTSCSSDEGNTTLLKSINIHGEGKSNSLEIQQKPLRDNNAEEKAKRIFFRSVDKTHTLAYVLRTSFGYKQAVLRTVLSLTFNEFLELTNVYEGRELYADNHIAESMYRYVFHSPLVWPTNLYITLKNLCKFLYKKNYVFYNYATMLLYISPKLLHWSVLLPCTNILDCVKMDFEKRTGKLLDVYDTKSLKQECIEYYNRCWKYEKWLGETPIVSEEFCKELSEDNPDGVITFDGLTVPGSSTNIASTHVNNLQDGVFMLDGLTVRGASTNPASNEVNNLQDGLVRLDELTVPGTSTCPANIENNSEEVNNLQVPDFENEIDINTTTEANISIGQEHKEFNCILLPNTQEQIDMLPVEEQFRIDPLNNGRNSPLFLALSESPHETYEVECLGELIQPIKTEPVGEKLLSNLLFYENDNNDIQCEACEEEIVQLDETQVLQHTIEENLPSPQIDFDKVAQGLMASNGLVNSDDIQSLISLAHQFPYSSESSDNIACAQTITHSTSQLKENTSTQLLQLPDISLQSSGEQLQATDSKITEPSTIDGYHIKILQSSPPGEIWISSQNLTVHQEAQRFPSTFDETQTKIVDEGNIPQPQQQFIEQTSEAGTELQQDVNIVDKQTMPSISKTIQPFKAKNQTNNRKAGLPDHGGVKKPKTATKNKRNVATVKPLQNSDMVPQIQHHRPPLQIVTVNTNNGNQALQSYSQTLAPTSVVISLTPNNSESSSGQSSQNSSFQLQLPNIETNICVSQELNRNFSVFDDTSLIRIVDHDYHQESTTNLTKSGSETDKVNSQSSKMCVPSSSKLTAPIHVSNTQQQTCHGRVTRSSNSLRKDTNNKNFLAPKKK